MSDDVRPDPDQPDLDGPQNDAAAADEVTAAAANVRSSKRATPNPNSLSKTLTQPE